MNVMDMVEQQQLREGVPDFHPGDTIKVHVKIKEGDKERIQIFEGVCIAHKQGGWPRYRRRLLHRQKLCFPR